MLTAKGLRKRYKQREVVADFGLTLQPGEVVGLLGPNGAGKTTCFYMIVGLVATDTGQILLDGKSVEITSATFNQIEFIAPASTPGLPELTIKFGAGTLIWINALSYFDPQAEQAKNASRQPRPEKASKPSKASKPKKAKR